MRAVARNNVCVRPWFEPHVPHSPGRSCREAKLQAPTT